MYTDFAFYISKLFLWVDRSMGELLTQKIRAFGRGSSFKIRGIWTAKDEK